MGGGHWSIHNVDLYLDQEVWESFVNHYVAAGMMLGVLVICLSYPIAHNIYMAKCQVYRETLTKDQQLVVVQHTIEAFFLTTIFAPLSYLMFSLFFEEHTDRDTLANKVVAIGTLMFVVVIMYMVEIASRFRSLRPLVMAHHLCAYLDSIYPAFFLTTANLKAASLLVYFITFEAITFMGLILYRLAPTHRATKPTILTGMIVFGISRPIQFIWIFGSLIATWEHLDVGHAIFQMVLTTFFTILQLYSLTIHWSLYQKCKRMGANDEETGSSNFDKEHAQPTTLSLEDTENVVGV
uniref:TLC domain-containing protein n=1 Tax=Entomoneis paludosa TaxID=265537 RepID=A0A7S2YG83_9STRA|mmetsp:Transcript_31925/g.66630  ORF Transcript_31925/g.66630 Transcript_31925/m.66630 type:complete len:295 (+) Transcript_31925:103-987(+)|eukprot:CAMPEP_0172457246 /NCGR_PEP_ID=MMETSP1065-20121228/21057_1 /TAXON_ID=265537 /ORGANISM="Amphiprora paludosa, Strain CCMP125" /LENGTH=294 /DNA_ID=CAMNT_0013210861 /DNA_START=72 /DNA_END=956 /DNA_ORIENTATION=-